MILQITELYIKGKKKLGLDKKFIEDIRGHTFLTLAYEEESPGTFSSSASASVAAKTLKENIA